MRTDVLVIGGGLAGTATAYYLAREGVDVLLVERFDLNTQASGSNAGSIHAQIPMEPFLTKGDAWVRGFAPTIPLMLASIRLWSGLEAELGADLEVSLRGGLCVAETDEQMRAVERKAAVERAQGLPVELLDRDELRQLAPYLAPSMIGASFCEIEGKANPLAVAPAFARAAKRHGATIRCGTAVQSIERGFTVATSDGPITARRIVNCAGAEAGRIAAMVSVTLPIEAHPIQVNVTEPVAPLIPHLVYFAGERLTLKQARSGGFLIGGGWPARLDPSGRPVVDPDSVRANLRAAIHVVPALRRVQLLRTWPALVNGTDDWRPILGELPGVPGMFIGMFPWLGFSAGPIAARCVADCVLGREPEVDIRAFSALPG